MPPRNEGLERILAPAIESLGCRLWGIEYSPGRQRALLRVYIDREEGVSVEDCERVSRQISGVLDVEGSIPGAFVLEVSSPGLDRILFTPEHYAESVGETVDVRLHQPFEGRRRIVGVLVGIEADSAVVRVDEEEFVLPLEGIMRARIVPRFD